MTTGVTYVAMHIKMRIISNFPTLTTGLSFDASRMGNGAFSKYSNGSGDAENLWLDYLLTISDIENHIPRKPQIFNTDNNPNKTYKAGTGDILTINGRFFANTQGLGNVYFKDADNKISEVRLDGSDIVSWSNNQIVVKVPSVVNLVNANPKLSYPSPGSGNFYIINDCGDRSNNFNILIDYSVLTDFSGSKPRYQEVGFTTPNSSEKRLTFNIDREVFDNTEAMQCIRAAMKQWSCATGINMEIGSVTTSTTTPKYSLNDGINTIFRNPQLSSSTLMGTAITKCNNNSFYNDRDIQINPAFTWDYSLNTVSLNSYHFYSVLIHEFGHVNNLNHTLNTDVMFPSMLPDVIKTALTQNDINGGINVMTASLSYNPASACNAFTMNAANKTTIGCYATSSQKMQLEGISISCKCAPSFSVPATLPILQPRIYGGVPPYYYFWESLTGNSATINNPYAEQPTVTACSLVNSARKVKYKLTVIDNATIPTIESRIIEVDLTASQTVNYAMRDSYEDLYNEFNNQAHWDIWNSPDIWNRKTNGTSNTEHENPEYFLAAPNYVNFRIRNVGCIPGILNRHAVRLYWTKSSTGEDWDQDWKTANSSNGKPEGREINAPTNGFLINPILNPGQEGIYSQAWFPPVPQDYPEFGTPPVQIDVCILARIESGTTAPPYNSPPHGMAISELFDLPTPQKALKQNVINNNDIVTRNLIVTNLNQNDINGPGGNILHYAFIDNVDVASKSYTIEFKDIFQTNLLDFNTLVK